MIKKLSFICILCFAISCVSVKKHNAGLGQKFSPEQLREDISFTYKKLQKLQPRLYQYTSKADLDFKFDSLSKSIVAPLDAKQLYTLLSPVVGEVRQGHIANGFPDRRFTKKELKALKKTKLDFYHLDLKYIEDGLYISRTGPRDSALIGSQLVAVGLETVPQLLKKYRKTIPPEGYNRTFRNRYIAKNFTALYAKHVGYRDSVSVILMQDDSVYVKHFKRYVKDSMRLKKKALDSSKNAKRFKPDKAAKKAQKTVRKKRKKQHKKYGYLPKHKLFTRNFKFLDSTAQIGYFNIRSWNNGPSKKFFRESFQKLDSAKTKNLIIDVRDNPGGNLDQIFDFYRYLTNSEFQFINPGEVKTRLPNIKNFYNRNASVLTILGQTMTLPYLLFDNLTRTKKRKGQLHYRFKESKMASPYPLNFKGKIYVLINGGSFSASTILGSKLHGTKRAVFIGEESGGAYNGTVAGHSKVINLPHTKLAFQLGLMQLETPHQQEPDGYGIQPDYEVQPSLIDFQNKRDTALDFVLELIKSEKE